jgi:hypothetical protein
MLGTMTKRIAKLAEKHRAVPDDALLTNLNVVH